MEKIKYLYRALRYRFLLDSSEIKYLNKNLKKGGIGVDIGCHKGGYLYWFLKNVGKQGVVYAFEPQLRLYEYLKIIQRIFNYRNVIIENKAASFQTGTTNLYIPLKKGNNSPGARIDHKKNGRYQKITIKTTTLDDYFLDKQIFPDLIKIDVEGHEKQVLLGGRKLLKKCYPKIILECENRHLEGENIFDVFGILLQMGYSGFFFKNNMKKPLKAFREDVHQKSEKRKFWQRRKYINNFVFEKAKQN